MKGFIKFAAVAICMCYGTSAVAEALTKLPYSYAQITYAKTDIDDIDVDADGFGIDLSYDLGNNFFITGSYGSAETDDFTVSGVRGSIQSTTFEAGLGYHHPLSAIVDIVPTVSIVHAENEGKSGFSAIDDDDDTGWAAGIQLRALIVPQVEISGGVEYSDVFDDNTTSFGVQAIWYPIEMLGVGVGYDVSDDAKTFGFGARVLF